MTTEKYNARKHLAVLFGKQINSDKPFLYITIGTL